MEGKFSKIQHILGRYLIFASFIGVKDNGIDKKRHNLRSISTDLFIHNKYFNIYNILKCGQFIKKEALCLIFVLFSIFVK